MELTSEELSRTVISTRVVEAPIGEMFDAYANPKKIVKWWGPSGFTLVTESLELKEGGEWKFVFTGPDGKEYKNHLAFRTIDRPRLFVLDHLNGPKYHGSVTFEETEGKTRVTMYWTFEQAEVFNKIKETVIAGNEGNFDRMSEVVAGRR